MDLRHYDNVAHDLNASYEDVQEGMSTPYGIARTTTLTLIPQKGYAGKKAFADVADSLAVNIPVRRLPDCVSVRTGWRMPETG